MGRWHAQDCRLGRAEGHEPDELDPAHQDTGVPFDELQAEQIQMYRDARASAGHGFTPRVSISRSVLPIVDDEDRQYFGLSALRETRDQVGILDGAMSRFGKSYVGEPDQLAEQLAADDAVQSADTLMLTVPNQLGVDYNAKLLRNVAEHIAPAIGWTPSSTSTT